MIPLPIINKSYFSFKSNETQKTMAQYLHATRLLGSAPNVGNAIAMYSTTDYQGGIYQGDFPKGKRNCVNLQS